MRTPISCVRCDTANDRTPWMPIAARSSAIDGERAEHAQLRRARRGVVLDRLGHRAHVRERLLGVGLVHDRPNRRQQRLRRHRRAHDQILRRVEHQRAVRLLQVRQVDLRLALPLEPAHVDVADHADDRRLAKREVEAAADRRGAVGQELLRERLADDRDGLAIGGVGLGDVAPLDERDVERLEEARRHEAQAGVVAVGAVAAAPGRWSRPARCRRRSVIGAKLM